VLLHGLGTTAVAWRPVLEALARRHRVSAFDLAGFGGSPPMEGEPTPWAHADLVESELDRLGLAAPHLCGSSFGGWIALELARRGRARSVTAFSPAGGWTGGERRYVQASLRLAHAQARLLAPLGPRAMTRPVREIVFAQIRVRPGRVPRDDAVREAQMTARRSFARTHRATLPHLALGLGAITSPTLIAWGERDRLFPPRQARRFATAIPGAETMLLPGVGHVPMWDDPKLVWSVILSQTRRAEAADGVAAPPA